MNRARITILGVSVVMGALLGSATAHAQHRMPGTPPAAAPAPAQPATSTPAAAPEQAVVLVAMTGDASVDPHLRSTADAIKRRVHERGYRDVESARLGAALAPPNDISTLRSRLNAGCLVRVDVQAHDLSGVSLRLVVETSGGAQTASVQASLGEISSKVLAAVDPLIPVARSVQPTPAPAPVPPPGPAAYD